MALRGRTPGGAPPPYGRTAEWKRPARKLMHRRFLCTALWGHRQLRQWHPAFQAGGNCHPPNDRRAAEGAARLTGTSQTAEKDS